VLTGVLIRFMVPDILLGRLVSIMQTLFNANMDLRTPLISTLIFTFAQTALAIPLVGALGVLGFPIAVSLASLSNAVYMLVKLQGRFGPVGWNTIRSFLVRLTATCAIGGVGFVVGSEFAALAPVSYSAAKVLDLAVPSAFGLCLFVVGAFSLRLIDSHRWPLLGRRAS
jgi:peptidoglycan biosynthesis protein MviN/MurJ (putative lipid II flippase)